MCAFGEVAEWSIAAVLKTVDPQGSGGSNPSLSAISARCRRCVRSQCRMRRGSALHDGGNNRVAETKKAATSCRSHPIVSADSVAGATAGDVIRLELTCGGETVATSSVTFVERQVSSPNPLLLGERDATTLRPGEWTMDRDLALSCVRADRSFVQNLAADARAKVAKLSGSLPSVVKVKLIDGCLLVSGVPTALGGVCVCGRRVPVGRCGRQMKEVYRLHTDEDYTTPEAAERWFAQRQADLDSEQASQ